MNKPLSRNKVRIFNLDDMNGEAGKKVSYGLRDNEAGLAQGAGLTAQGDQI